MQGCSNSSARIWLHYRYTAVLVWHGIFLFVCESKTLKGLLWMQSHDYTICNILLYCYDKTYCTYVWGMSPSWPVLGLLSWCSIFQSCQRHSFEDRAPVDFIYGCPIFGWVAGTWLHNRLPGWYRSDSRLAPSQWETSLQSNAVSHWLSANLQWFPVVAPAMAVQWHSMVRTGLEKSWNLTLDWKSHWILCWPGKMAFCLEKSLKIRGSHWKFLMCHVKVNLNMKTLIII